MWHVRSEHAWKAACPKIRLLGASLPVSCAAMRTLPRGFEHQPHRQADSMLQSFMCWYCSKCHFESDDVPPIWCDRQAVPVSFNVPGRRHPISLHRACHFVLGVAASYVMACVASTAHVQQPHFLSILSAMPAASADAASNVFVVRARTPSHCRGHFCMLLQLQGCHGLQVVPVR